MSAVNDLLNRRTLEMAVALRRAFPSMGEEDEVEGSIYLHSLVCVVLGSCLRNDDDGTDIVVKSPPPDLVRDGMRARDAIEAMLRDDENGEEPMAGDIVCVLLQAVLAAMAPVLHDYVQAKIEAGAQPN